MATVPPPPFPVFVVACLGLLGSALRATPEDEAILAATRPGDASSYTWTRRITDDRTGLISLLEGKTQPQLGRSHFLDRTPSAFLQQALTVDPSGRVEFYYDHSTAVCWVLAADQWSEVRNLGWRQTGEVDLPSGSGGRGPARVGNSPGQFGTQVEDYRLRLRAPHEDLELIVSQHLSLDVGNDSFVGELSPGGAAQLLPTFGQLEERVRDPMASFECWIVAGEVVRYEFRVQARLGSGLSSRSVQQTIRVELASEFSPPADLSAPPLFRE